MNVTKYLCTMYFIKINTVLCKNYVNQVYNILGALWVIEKVA